MKTINTLAGALLLAAAGSAAADVIREGPAANASVSGSHLIYPSGTPADEALRPSEHRAADAQRPSEHRSAETLRPGSSQVPALRPGEASAPDSLRPSENRADRALRPGETKTREVYNPRSYGEPPAVQRRGPATTGGVRSSGRAYGASAGSASAPASSWNLALGAKGALPPGVPEVASDWYRKRSLTRPMFEGLKCGRLKYVEHDGETFRLCKGAWVRRFQWGGETTYVAIYPPTGAVLDELPADYRKQRVGNKTYLLVHATFYERSQELGRDVFEVVPPPLGAVVPAIPRFSLEIEPGWFQFDTVFYRRMSDSAYEIVSPPR